MSFSSLLKMVKVPPEASTFGMAYALAFERQVRLERAGSFCEPGVLAGKRVKTMIMRTSTIARGSTT